MGKPRIFASSGALMPVMDVVEAARFAAREGFAGLDIRPNPLDFWPTTAPRRSLAELELIGDGEGIGYVFQIPDSVNPAAALPEDCMRDVDLLKRSVDIARLLGSPVLSVHPGVARELTALESHGHRFETLRFERELILVDARARAIETLADWADLIAQAGLVLAIKNEGHVPHTVAQTAGILAGLLDTIGRENARANLVTGNSVIGGGLAQEFAILQKRIAQIHLNDGRTPGADKELPLGDGTGDFSVMADFLATFPGAVTLEIFAPEQPAEATLASRDFLLRLLAVD